MKEKMLEIDLRYIFESVEKDLYKLKDSTILITGYAGFLGYYLTLFLLKHAEILNLELLCIDNLMFGKPKWQIKLEKNPRFKTYAIGVENIDALLSIPELSNVNYIVHMASIASPVYYRLHPLETFHANVYGLECFGNMFLNGKLPNLKRMLCLSSSEIYGNPDQDHIPTREDYFGYVSCTGPRSCYDEAKRSVETLCWIYGEHYGMPVSIMRPFNVYGPGMHIDDRRLPADLAASVLNNRNIILYSDGTPTRAFCYISDAIVGMLKIMLYPNNDIFNIGNGHNEISVIKLAQIYREIGKNLFCYTGDIVFRNHVDSHYLLNNPQRRCPDTTKASILLGYEPKIEIKEGIKRYLLYLKG